MKLLKPGIALAMVGAGLAATPTVAAEAAPQRSDDGTSLVQKMRSEADGNVAVKKSSATDRVSFVRSTGDLAPTAQDGTTKRGAAAKAQAYVDEYAGAFGATSKQLEQTSVHKSPAGFTVDFAQTHRGVPVFGSKLRAHVDKQGDLTSVNGFVAPDLDVGVEPRLSKADATSRALRMAAESPAGAGDGEVAKPKKGDLSVTTAELMIYRMGALQGIEGDNLLTWVVEVTDGHMVRETAVLDANTGKPVNRYSMIAHALDRDLHEESIENPPVWSEGDAFPGELDVDQRNEVQGTGESYWFFMNSFGRDSFDDAGAKMITVNNDPNIQCPNANWNGVSTNYCSGVSADDTVAHEWGHAYTEHTSGLLYQWQSGAMNEAYSDIWGETVDMLNGRMDDPDEATLRTDDQCSMGTRGSISLVISDPVGTCTAAPAAFGPIIDDVSGDLVVGIDAANEEGPATTDGCSPFENAADLDGKFVFVDRGTCAFATKMANAEDAGAVGIIFGNNDAGLVMVAGDSDLYGAMVTQEDATKIKANADNPMTITMADAEADPRDASFRWLSGEDDPAFGGAIRDMWSPTCYGDPGKVSDEEYHCGTDDNGGVHTNSGVVNHTYALLVDGGTSNGVTVPGIGLDKAAHIFWHTQTNYLTPISNFVDLADGLEASCADLTGNESLNTLAIGTSESGGAEVTPEAMDPITADDCAALTAATQATELRVDPEQCNFRMMFNRGEVSCGGGLDSDTVWGETFENGMPEDWTQDVEYFSLDTGDEVLEGQAHFDPEIRDVTDVKVTDGGKEHQGGANALYFNDKGESGNFGSCAFDEDDYSSRVGLATPALTVPEGLLPRLTFDHYVASEVGWDGGNLKVSVNDGDYELVPDTAWLYNGPGGRLNTLGDGNTNPMAGQAAFTGTDGGQPTGSWGHSAINIAAFAKPGDTVSFRFDFGMDGCNGIEGWYIDNVELTVCDDAAPAAVASKTTAKAKPKKLKNKKKTAKVKVKVTAKGTTPSGKVKITLKGKKKVLAQGKLNKNGKVTLKIKGKWLKKGKNKLVAKYLGNKQVKASKATFKIKRKK